MAGQPIGVAPCIGKHPKAMTTAVLKAPIAQHCLFNILE
jgi:hypothetical protein